MLRIFCSTVMASYYIWYKMYLKGSAFNTCNVFVVKVVQHYFKEINLFEKWIQLKKERINSIPVWTKIFYYFLSGIIIVKGKKKHLRINVTVPWYLNSHSPMCTPSCHMLHLMTAVGNFHGISTFSGISKPNQPFLERQSLSSSYHAGSTDIPDPLSSLLPIVHRPR